MGLGRVGAGAHVDAVGSALTWAMLAGGERSAAAEAVVGWLATRQSAGTGLWGTARDGLREPVNGAYRALRGTLHLWGLPVGRPRALVDAVLRRAAELRRGTWTACDALDVVQLLWWSRRVDPDHRSGEVADVAAHVLDLATGAWVPGRGLPFAPGLEPTLQGTEMWLALAWYAADLIDRADDLGYRPRGVHRPDPLLDLGALAPSGSSGTPGRGRIGA
ncbi:hypothetical protein GCM10025865_07650 [Paraoerskovia sediminicola]|uniref:Squalene cyclase C-terminal domain-containing protein n=1 Tax=Paraoerskovia sediminicola TaxID=1138587 RepID=A0ABM8G0E0_9CELL|nr:hypothetical protein GCM10025865_07650 [Paraoerskovia sediminicola]